MEHSRPPCPSPGAPRLEVRGVSKSFPGVQALTDVSLAVVPGEILAVVGENGAGKSTLMKIMAGIERADTGDLRVNGSSVAFRSPADALASGIALIHQELNLCPNLDVASNVFLGREPRRWGLIDRKRLHEDAEPLIRQVGLKCGSRAPLAGLSIAQQQMVEIAKALSVEAGVLIMDEPTSSLTLSETEQLYAVIRSLQSRGVSILYISHRLREVEALASRVLVLRDGCRAGELSGSAITREAMTRLMIGRDLSGWRAQTARSAGQVRLQISALRTAAYPRQEINLTIRAGEIVGLAGLVGAGRTELLRAIFGIDTPCEGRVQINGADVPPGNPMATIDRGVALVPEDRKLHGIIVQQPVQQNIGLPGLRRFARAGMIRNADRESKDAETIRTRFQIKTPDLSRPVQTLSGGNQQKIALGKWIPLNPALILLDEPTRGVDIGAKEEIYRLIEELALQGVAILFASSEMSEILALADRVLVMHEGRLAGELPREQATEESILRLATNLDDAGQPQQPADIKIS